MQRKSWNAIRLERLSAALKKAGNTVEAFNAMMEFEELLPLEAQELAQQVNWPAAPKAAQPSPELTRAFQQIAALPAEKPAAPTPAPMTIKTFGKPTEPPKLVIKRY